MSTFTPGIPTTGQSLGITKQPIQDNFTTINTTLSVNHVAMNSLDQGKHKFCTFPSQGTSSAGSPATGVNEMNLYSRIQTGLDGNQPNLYLQYGPKAAGQADVLLTRVIGPVANTNGYSWIAGGLVLQWGTISPLAGTGTVNFATLNIAFPQNCFNVIATLSPTSPPTTNAQAISVYNLNTSGFSYNYSGGSAYNRFYWFAIGN